MKIKKQLLIGFIIILIIFSIVYYLIETKPKVIKEKRGVILPLVEVIVGEKTDYDLKVKGYGYVKPKKELDLTALVSGQIIYKNKNFESGKFINKNDTIIIIEQTDYRANLAQAQRQYSEAVLNLEKEKQAAQISIERWEKFSDTPPSDLVAHKFQLDLARKNVEAATAAVQKALKDLQNTVIRAPYDCIVENVNVEEYQVVPQSYILGKIASIDTAIIEFPISVNYINYLFNYNEFSQNINLSAKINYKINNKVYTRDILINRIKQFINKETSMAVLVSEIPKPYTAPILPFGLFTTGIIKGRRVKDIIIVPQKILSVNNEIAYLDDNDFLRRKKVNVVYKDENNAVIKDDSLIGKRICINGYQNLEEGVKVKVKE